MTDPEPDYIAWEPYPATQHPALNSADWLGFPPGTVEMTKPVVVEMPDGSFQVTYRLRVTPEERK